MTDQNTREQALNAALEALHFAFRQVVAHPDRILAKHGLSRQHHRILYFVGRNPGLNINALLAILNITKQSLNAPLRQLLEGGWVCASTDPADRRLRRLHLSPAGAALEAELSGDQRARFERVFAEVGPEGEAMWHRVMALLAR